MNLKFARSIAVLAVFGSSVASAETTTQPFDDAKIIMRRAIAANAIDIRFDDADEGNATVTWTPKPGEPAVVWDDLVNRRATRNALQAELDEMMARIDQPMTGAEIRRLIFLVVKLR